MAADVELHRESLRWRDTPRWQLAASDANVKFPEAAEIFACAAGIRISQASTPNLYSLLQRVDHRCGKIHGTGQGEIRSSAPVRRV